MNTTYEERLSDSPYIDRIGRFRVDKAYSRSCPANILGNMLLVKYKGKTSLSMWGPETKVGIMNYPAGAEFLFIAFKLGTFMPRLPITNIVDTGITLPDATNQSFWLDSESWQYPDYENADTFVDWLVREGLLVHEPIVDVVLQDHPLDMALRTVRHRFLRATGLTRSYIRQVEHARQAVVLLEKGVSILDTVNQVGYADQPHLTRSLKRLVGQTPAQIARESQAE
jgi:AraC-like DNA-binding protein